MKYKLKNPNSISALAKANGIPITSLWDMIYVKKMLPLPDERQGKRWSYSPECAERLRQEIKKIQIDVERDRICSEELLEGKKWTLHKLRNS